MALSERSLRQLRKIADLDAKREAAHAAKDVADRRATALQDALAERAGRIAALERACRLPAGDDDDAAAALEAAAEAAERDAVAAELAAAADARRAAEDRRAAAKSRAEHAESRISAAALETQLTGGRRDAVAAARRGGKGASAAATAAADSAAEAAAAARALDLAETTRETLARDNGALRARLAALARDQRYQTCRAAAADAAASAARRRAKNVVSDANRCAAEVRRAVARDAERAALLDRVAELEAEVARAALKRPRTPSPPPSPAGPAPKPSPPPPRPASVDADDAADDAENAADAAAAAAWTSDAVLEAAWASEFARSERVATRENEKARVQRLRDWARLAVRRDEQRSWGKVLADSTERIPPAGLLTFSLKEVFGLSEDEDPGPE